MHHWERRLGELNVMVEAVEPPPEVWDKIKTELGPVEPAEHIAPTAEEEFFSPIEELMHCGHASAGRRARTAAV